jgi:hypothetical protein
MDTDGERGLTRIELKPIFPNSRKFAKFASNSSFPNAMMARVHAFSAKIWTAVAKRSGDTAFRTSACESGVALRFPPQSKRVAAALPRWVIRVHLWFQLNGSA